MIGFKLPKPIWHFSEKYEMPSQFEQDIAEAYCCSRKLYRPNTNIKKIVKYVLFVEGFALVIVFFIFKILKTHDSYSNLASVCLNIYYKHPILFFLLLYIGLNVIIFLLFIRKIAIGVIRLYQHYAPEDVRRRCLFMPTCSEYTILVIQKYGIIIGLYKAYIRLFKKCRGSIYRIDYPC